MPQPGPSDYRSFDHTSARERPADRLEREVEQRVGAAPRDLLDHGLDQRSREMGAAQADLPARAHADGALDQQPGVLVDPWITHDAELSSRRLPQ